MKSAYLFIAEVSKDTYRFFKVRFGLSQKDQRLLTLIRIAARNSHCYFEEWSVEVNVFLQKFEDMLFAMDHLGVVMQPIEPKQLYDCILHEEYHEPSPQNIESKRIMLSWCHDEVRYERIFDEYQNSSNNRKGAMPSSRNKPKV